MIFGYFRDRSREFKLIDIFRLSVGKIIRMIRELKAAEIDRSIPSILSEIHPEPGFVEGHSNSNDPMNKIVNLLINLSDKLNSLEDRIQRVESYITVNNNYDEQNNFEDSKSLKDKEPKGKKQKTYTANTTDITSNENNFNDSPNFVNNKIKTRPTEIKFESEYNKKSEKYEDRKYKSLAIEKGIIKDRK